MSAEEVYFLYAEKWGYPPKKACHLLNFSKSIDKKISWKEACSLMKNSPTMQLKLSKDDTNQSHTASNEPASISTNSVHTVETTRSESNDQAISDDQSANFEEIEAMKRYQILMSMGFDTDSTWQVAKKYNNIELCVDYLTKTVTHHTNTDKSADSQSIVGSLFKMMYSFTGYDRDTNNDIDDTLIHNVSKCVINTDIWCTCGAKMILKNSENCYNNTDYLFVICDKCDKKCSQNVQVYHCAKLKTREHPDGYDICQQCAVGDKNINVQTCEQKQNYKQPFEIVHVDEKSDIKQAKVLKRALIIQAPLSVGNVQCIDAIELEKSFNVLGYETTVILPSEATRQNINTTLEKLYYSDSNQNKITGIHTIICYTGHGSIMNRTSLFSSTININKSFCFHLKNDEKYYDTDLYKIINHKVNLSYFQAVKQGFFNNNSENKTLLLINACHSGSIMKENMNVEKQQNKDKQMMTTRQKQTMIFAFVCAFGFIFYLIRSYDDKSRLDSGGKQLISNVVDVEKSAKIQIAIQTAKTKVNSGAGKQWLDGLEKAASLDDRLRGDSTDFDWNDLKHDLLARWRKWRGSEQQFAEHHVQLLMKEAGKTSNEVEINEQKACNIRVSIDENCEKIKQWWCGSNGSNVQIDLLDPTKKETWANLANYFSQSVSNQWKSAILGTPFVSVCMLVAGAWKYWMHTRTNDKIQLITSCKQDQQSNFVGGISPFFRSVIDYMQQNGQENGGILNGNELKRKIYFDAKHKVLEFGTTLEKLQQEPQSHFMTK